MITRATSNQYPAQINFIGNPVYNSCCENDDDGDNRSFSTRYSIRSHVTAVAKYSDNEYKLKSTVNGPHIWSKCFIISGEKIDLGKSQMQSILNAHLNLFKIYYKCK